MLSEQCTPRPAQPADITEPRRGEGNRAPATTQRKAGSANGFGFFLTRIPEAIFAHVLMAAIRLGSVTATADYAYQPRTVLPPVGGDNLRFFLIKQSELSLQ